jgi:hypothetical protein
VSATISKLEFQRDLICIESLLGSDLLTDLGHEVKRTCLIPTFLQLNTNNQENKQLEATQSLTRIW